MSDPLVVAGRAAIPRDELRFRFARSGGPGGQNVNKTATQVELLFDVARSPSLDETQRTLVLSRLANRIDSEGVLRLVSRASRSQLENREDVTARFVALLERALTPPKPRRATKPSRGAKERRLLEKKRRGVLKRARGTGAAEE